MSGTGFLRLKKLKGPGIVAVAARHNRRAIQAEVGAAQNIDPSRAGMNQTLHGPATPEGVALLAGKLLRDAGIGKLRKDAVMALEFVFSLPPDNGLDEQRYFEDCAAWAGQQFGGADNVLSVDVHRDEAAPHCHVLLLPLMGGRMVGSDMMGNRRKLLEVQHDFHQAVAQRYGLKKAAARLSGASKNRAASAVLTHLKKTSDAALRSKVWPAIRDRIEGDPAPYLLALGINIEQPKKRLRSMTAIFTSPGKGPKKESNPIGFGEHSKGQPLCSVGFAPTSSPSTAAPSSATPEPSACGIKLARVKASDNSGPETTRVRDQDLDPANFDPQTGEFRPPATRPASLKAAAVAWVTAALATTTGQDASYDPAAMPRLRDGP